MYWTGITLKLIQKETKKYLKTIVLVQNDE